MVDVAIIGGTGLNTLKNLEIVKREMMSTPYGQPSAPLVFGEVCGIEVVFLARHGSGHTIPPHKVNYRANLWALHHSGVRKVIAVAAVGGIRSDMAPGTLAFPDQIIDYTYSRGNTFFENDLQHVNHIDFTYPYCKELRQILLEAAAQSNKVFSDHGTYGASQGPRLETAAEILRMERDGCHMVGMTGMPEAALARELQICYATCAVVANWAAGKGGEGLIEMHAIEKHLKSGMQSVRKVIELALPLLNQDAK